MHLDDRVRLRVIHGDETPLGSAVTGRCDDVLRAACPEIVELYRARGIAEVVRRGPELLDRAFSSPSGLGGYFDHPSSLAPSFLWPDPTQVRPASLIALVDDSRGVQVSLDAGLAADLARWLGDWQHDATRPSDATAAALFDALDRTGAFTAQPKVEPRNDLGDVTFVGHACLRFAAADGQGGGVLVDPWLLAPDPADPPGYAPLGVRELAPVRAVLLTHAHPDHFDPGTLLRFGQDTPIYVPRVDRESVLAVDIALRLRELGFTAVHALEWGSRVTVAGLEIEALPFYGEQPATDEVLHPEVRNAGNVYAVRAPYGRFVLTVDSGRDPLGDARTLARAARQRSGPIDVLFAGCRGFALYPVHYLFSSVARFLPFVPRELWGQRQQIMNDADDALDVAELWGARAMVPYADGGAPWYWRLGLGPVLDGHHTPIAAVDPAPEHALLAGRHRSGSSAGVIASPVEVMVMRPNDRLIDRARVRPAPWPYPPLAGLPEDTP